MRIKNTKGFTLLEVIIVVIIVAVLASVAMPKISSSINFSKAKEALGFISAARTAMEQCYLMQNNTYTNCDCDASTAGSLCEDILGVSMDGKYFQNYEIVGADATDYTIQVWYGVSKAAGNANWIKFATADDPSITGGGYFSKLVAR